MKKFLYLLACAPIDIFRLLTGLRLFNKEGKTPEPAYQAMIRMFCLTGGWSRDFLAARTARRFPKYRMSAADLQNGLLQDPIDEVITHLNNEGYYVFQSRIPDDICDRLLSFATSTPARIRLMDKELAIAGDDIGNNTYGDAVIYDRSRPVCIRYDFWSQDLIDNPDVQKLMADMSFVSVAQEYLGASPVLDVVSMWWHTAYSSVPDKAAAQYFHFDMDRIKWLKFFIYLTDVDSDAGPHTFIRGSHKRGGIPLGLRSAGYARLSDDEVRKYYDDKDFIEFNAPRGTIIAEDTSGLHKGKHVLKGDRLLLQMQFSVSLFGTEYRDEKASLSAVNDELARRISHYPRLYSRYTGDWK